MKLKFKPATTPYSVLTMTSCASLDDHFLTQDVHRAFKENPTVQEVRTHYGAITRKEWAEQKGLPESG